MTEDWHNTILPKIALFISITPILGLIFLLSESLLIENINQLEEIYIVNIIILLLISYILPTIGLILGIYSTVHNIKGSNKNKIISIIAIILSVICLLIGVLFGTIALLAYTGALSPSP